jgi:hypothetical protein
MRYSLRLINVACLNGQQLFVPMRHFVIPLDWALHPRAISFDVLQMRDVIRSTVDLGTRFYRETAAGQIAQLALAPAPLALITDDTQ